jgi:hypothetical protein
MSILSILILAVASVSMFFNVGYIIHELGWYPHTKDRKTPAEKKFWFNSRYDFNRLNTHDFYVTHPFTIELRKVGHAEIYNFKDPYQALENVISRYKESQTRSRYDDLVNLSNYISNQVKSDEKINALIEQATDIFISHPFKTN